MEEKESTDALDYATNIENEDFYEQGGEIIPVAVDVDKGYGEEDSP